MDVKNTTTQELDQSLKIQTTAAQDVESAGSTPTKSDPSKWKIYNGYYKEHVAISAVIKKLRMWSVGKGYKADKRTTNILDKIRGWGKETFNGVIGNQIGVEHINGDSYAEIITPEGEKIKPNGSNLLNLKPLNPGTMIQEVDSKGMLQGYIQTNSNGTETPFDVEEIFHLVLNRTADEITGTGDIEVLITFLDKIKQLDEDMAVMFHRFVVPLVIWKLNTDDPTAMAEFKKQSKKARNGGDDMVISDKATEWSLLEAGVGVGKTTGIANKALKELGGYVETLEVLLSERHRNAYVIGGLFDLCKKEQIQVDHGYGRSQTEFDRYMRDLFPNVGYRVRQYFIAGYEKANAWALPKNQREKITWKNLSYLPATPYGLSEKERDEWLNLMMTVSYNELTRMVKAIKGKDNDVISATVHDNRKQLKEMAFELAETKGGCTKTTDKIWFLFQVAVDTLGKEDRPKDSDDEILEEFRILLKERPKVAA